MEKHVMRLSYGLCLLCAVLALVARTLAALGLPSTIFPGSPTGVGYHGFMDGVILFFMTTVATACFAWAKKNFA
jgi:hypothetical protein